LTFCYHPFFVHAIEVELLFEKTRNNLHGKRVCNNKMVTNMINT
jgi:hypothetical protein